MTITLYNNQSEMNAVTKTKTTLQTLTGHLRDGTSIIDPVLHVSDITGVIAQVNYLYIAEFNRYYFIKNISSIRLNIWEIECHVDVLASYATEIKAQTAVIKRQENEYNLYLDDGIFKTYQNPYVITKKFPTGFSTQQFVLAVAGG